MLNSDQDKLGLEKAKLASDTFKHITTLAAGALVLLVTFFDKLPKPLIGRGWLIASVVSLLACLFWSFAFLIQFGIPDDREYRERLGSPHLKWVIAIAYYTFFLGLFGLGTVAVENLWVSR